jgi:hypothetical protein
VIYKLSEIKLQYGIGKLTPVLKNDIKNQQIIEFVKIIVNFLFFLLNMISRGKAVLL